MTQTERDSIREETSAPLVQLRGLSKEFRPGRERVCAVRSLRLDIFPGEGFGLVGQVLFLGRDVTRPSPRERKALCRSMQIIFQDPYSSIDPLKPIGWLVEEPLQIHKWGKSRQELRERALDMLRAVGLDETYWNRLPGELSGGQRQRVAIAIALVLHPEFVVCDEPVSALDVSVQAQVLNLLLELRRKLGLTYLFISHDLHVVSYLADRVGVMYLGELVELGSCGALVQHPLHPYTRALFSASAEGEGRIVLSGDLPSPAHPPEGCPFHTRCFACGERCRQEKPLLRQVEPGRLCACHRAEEFLAEGLGNSFGKPLT